MATVDEKSESRSFGEFYLDERIYGHTILKPSIWAGRSVKRIFSPVRNKGKGQKAAEVVDRIFHALILPILAVPILLLIPLGLTFKGLSSLCQDLPDTKKAQPVAKKAQPKKKPLVEKKSSQKPTEPPAATPPPKPKETPETAAKKKKEKAACKRIQKIVDELKTLDKSPEGLPKAKKKVAAFEKSEDFKLLKEFPSLQSRYQCVAQMVKKDEVDVEGDGNCGLRAVALFLDGVSHVELRKELMAWIDESMDASKNLGIKLKDLEPEKQQKILREMRYYYHEYALKNAQSKEEKEEIEKSLKHITNRIRRYHKGKEVGSMEKIENSYKGFLQERALQTQKAICGSIQNTLGSKIENLQEEKKSSENKVNKFQEELKKTTNKIKRIPVKSDLKEATQRLENQKKTLNALEKKFEKLHQILEKVQEKNFDLFDTQEDDLRKAFREELYPEYKAKMSTNRTWVSAYELHLISQIKNIRIEIYDRGHELVEQRNFGPEYLKTVARLVHKGNHYDALCLGS